ncbi:type II toxin-antitoxin system RelE family toxin [Enterococcus olivae]
MSFKVAYDQTFIKAIKKMDRPQAEKIMNYIEKNLVGCENPRSFGKGLTAGKSGFWRYRVGNYRIIADILDNDLVILCINVGHRSQIYKTKR